MSKYLIKVEEMYRADTDAEAAQIIEDAKTANGYDLVSFSSVKKAKKQKGEIVDEFVRVKLVKAFDDETEPSRQVSVEYHDAD